MQFFGEIRRFHWKYAGTHLRLCWHFYLIQLNFSFDFTEEPSPQRNYSERSALQQRRLGKSMASLRQLVESKGKLQYIPKCASDYPRMCFSQSTKVAPSISPEGEESHPDITPPLGEVGRGLLTHYDAKEWR